MFRRSLLIALRQLWTGERLLHHVNFFFFLLRVSINRTIDVVVAFVFRKSLLIALRQLWKYISSIECCLRVFFSVRRPKPDIFCISVRTLEYLFMFNSKVFGSSSDCSMSSILPTMYIRLY